MTHCTHRTHRTHTICLSLSWWSKNLTNPRWSTLSATTTITCTPHHTPRPLLSISPITTKSPENRKNRWKLRDPYDDLIALRIRSILASLFLLTSHKTHFLTQLKGFLFFSFFSIFFRFFSFFFVFSRFFSFFVSVFYPGTATIILSLWLLDRKPHVSIHKPPIPPNTPKPRKNTQKIISQSIMRLFGRSEL